ncbi:MAG: molybdopterin-binding protein [Bacillota bacterium]|nr:molybdopterin-binding protein [Bacillota bacterium]
MREEGQAPAEHRAKGKEAWPSLVTAFCTVSDTRRGQEDRSAEVFMEKMAGAGHEVRHRAQVPDEKEAIRRVVAGWLADPHLDAIVTSGGTGLSGRDVTVAALRPLLDKEIPGFGELFRWLSFQEIGPAAMLSGALAGAAAGKLLVILPGSPKAVALALDKLLLPELSHLLWEIRR